mmetsp:Transcript_7168/g.19204  ORF Transcript_7168/g.19204 Transcript_7168/m.19204 type:complete len:96 (-) Transcript_7168:944-1231(-)
MLMCASTSTPVHERVFCTGVRKNIHGSLGGGLWNKEVRSKMNARSQRLMYGVGSWLAALPIFYYAFYVPEMKRRQKQPEMEIEPAPKKTNAPGRT